jgi:hypothetical protein
MEPAGWQTVGMGVWIHPYCCSGDCYGQIPSVQSGSGPTKGLNLGLASFMCLSVGL